MQRHLRSPNMSLLIQRQLLGRLFLVPCLLPPFQGKQKVTGFPPHPHFFFPLGNKCSGRHKLSSKGSHPASHSFLGCGNSVARRVQPDLRKSGSENTHKSQMTGAPDCTMCPSAPGFSPSEHTACPSLQGPHTFSLMALTSFNPVPSSPSSQPCDFKCSSCHIPLCSYACPGKTDVCLNERTNERTNKQYCQCQ